MPATNASGSGALQTLRLLFMSFALAPVYIGVVAFFVTEEFIADDGPNVPALIGVGAFGVVALILWRVVGPKLDGSNAATAVETYRSRFFVRLAVAESATLVGFVAAIMTGEFLPFLVGAPFSIIGFARSAPSDRNIAKDQEVLNQAGSPVQLKSLLGDARPQTGSSST